MDGFNKIPWEPSDNILAQLRELRRDFMQPLANGRELHALRIVGANNKDIASLKPIVDHHPKAMGCKCHFLYTNQDQTIYGLFSEDPVLISSGYINEHFVGLTADAYRLFVANNHPDIDPDHTKWACGFEWLRMLFERMAPDQVDYAYTQCNADGKVKIVSTPHRPTPFDESENTFLNPLYEKQSVEHDNILILTNNVRTASAQLISNLINVSVQQDTAPKVGKLARNRLLDNRMLSRKEVAARLSISVRTLERRMKDETFRDRIGAKRVSKQWRFIPEHVESMASSTSF